VLYHSRFAGPWEEAGLRALLERLRAHNAARDLTGLLLCSDDRFVQVLEGPEAAVRALYARIRRDPRHRDVATLREGLGPRRFAGWAMGFGYVPGPDLHSTVAALDAPGPRLAPGVSDPQLRALLDALE
jgi:hypothetical protein